MPKMVYTNVDKNCNTVGIQIPDTLIFMSIQLPGLKSPVFRMLLPSECQPDIKMSSEYHYSFQMVYQNQTIKSIFVRFWYKSV